MVRHLPCGLILIVMLGLAMAPASAAVGGNPNPGVIPLNAKVAGLTYADYGDLVNEWFLLFQVGSPGGDQTGEWAYLGQPGGPVFYLANTAQEPGHANIAERWVTVPSDKGLLLPLATEINCALDMCLDASGTCATGLSTEEIADFCRSCVATCMDQVTGLYASVDGRPLSDLTHYRVTSPDYVTCPYAAGAFGLAEPGEVAVGVSDNYLLILAPLSPGEHTVSFGANWPQLGEGTVCGVIYHITVK
jgi:hypothetical protein